MRRSAGAGRGGRGEESRKKRESGESRRFCVSKNPAVSSSLSVRCLWGRTLRLSTPSPFLSASLKICAGREEARRGEREKEKKKGSGSVGQWASGSVIARG